MTDTIGQQLKKAREEKNLTIQKVVQATRIRAYQIEAIEADDFDSLPSPVQARAFLRIYTEFLGLSLDEIIAFQRDGVTKIIEAPSNSISGTNGRTASETEVGATSPSTDTKIVSNKIKEFLNHVKRIVPIPGLQHAQDNASDESNQLESNEPEKVSNPSQNIESDNEELIPSNDEVPAPPPETLPSQITFTSIGMTLRQRRESLSLTLEEIEHHIHVRKHYLEALEAGEFNRLPSSVQARGMLNNYAHFIDLDVDALLLTFAEGLQTQRLERQPKPEETSQKPNLKNPFKIFLPFKIEIPAKIRRYLSIDIFVGGGLVTVLLIFAIWGTGRIINLRAGITPQPTARSFSNILISSPEAPTTTPSPTTSGDETSTIIPMAGETMVITLPAEGQGPVQVVVIAEEQAWVRVSVDYQVEFEGRMTAGTALPFDGNTQIEVLTGNGIAISILYNQNNLGPMGNFGEVVDRIYTVNAILNPTATPTPTPSITPTPTITLRPSTTPRPSATPRFSPTPTQ